MSLRSAALFVAFSCVAPFADASAILVEQPGSLVTLDTSTGIEWADLSIAAAPTLAEALAVAEAAAGPGWSLATRAHVLGLVEPFLALPVYDGGPSGLPSTDSRLLPIILALGTNLYMDDRFYTEAIYAEGAGTAWALIRYEWGSRSSHFFLGSAGSSIAPNQYFLVRAVPEPATAALLGLGIAALGLRRASSPGSRARSLETARRT